MMTSTLDGSGKEDWWVANYDDTSVNPNIIRPQDTLELERYMASLAALPFSLRPYDIPSSSEDQ